MATQFATQAITITATTLATGAARESASVTTDTAQNVDDYRITVKATLPPVRRPDRRRCSCGSRPARMPAPPGMATRHPDAAITLDSPHQFAFGVAIPFPATT
jgi:hypothetical protein